MKNDDNGERLMTLSLITLSGSYVNQHLRFSMPRDVGSYDKLHVAHRDTECIKDLGSIFGRKDQITFTGFTVKPELTTPSEYRSLAYNDHHFGTPFSIFNT